MATCKDCLHYEACKSMLESLGHVVDGAGEDADKRCETFADKYRFIELPLRLGQDAWCIRDYKGVKQPQKSEVSEMYFNCQMKLIIVVKYVGRGEYGKNVFRTKEEAEAALNERINKHENNA